MSSDEGEEANSEFEKVSEFDIDENEIASQPQNNEPEINLDEYEGELGNFEEEFEVKEMPKQ